MPQIQHSLHFLLAVYLFGLVKGLSSSSAVGGRSVSFPSSFRFAENGVCLDPYYFVELDDSNDTRKQVFTMRNVPGEGDCMFLAVALAAATSMGLGGNDALLRAISRETRGVVADLLESSLQEHSQAPPEFYIGQGYPNVPARSLLLSATQQEGLESPHAYLKKLRLEGRNGGLYGGGPELTVLSNVLRRPISIYEVMPSMCDGDRFTTEVLSDEMTRQIHSSIASPPNPSNNKETTDDNTSRAPPSSLPIVCKGTFGNGLFEDPCETLNHSAVLESELHQLGAYSWHLHILVLDVVLEKPTRKDENEPVIITRSQTGEKHACVLLPRSMTSK